MRLIATLQDEKQGILLSNYLNSQNIENVVEASTGHNWGAENYGLTTYTVWVIGEQYLEKAIAIAKDFIQKNDKGEFERVVAAHLSTPHAKPSAPFRPPENSDPYKEQLELHQDVSDSDADQTENIEPFGRGTLYLLMLCCLLFFMSKNPAPPPEEVKVFTEQSLPVLPLYYSPLKKSLLFDYPHAYEIVDEFLDKIDRNETDSTEELTKNISGLKSAFQDTRYWQGFYDKAVNIFHKKATNWNIDTPIFEKLQQGEVWRLLSPIFLHADVFHLLFNMILLAVLGRQLEERLGFWRFIFFVVITGILANLAQYLMTGFNFLGISGVLCAMLTFIWTRQRKTPWEGYQLHSSTFNFAVFFLFIVLALQLVSFYTEITYDIPSTIQIANTAHMTGLLIGLFLGNINFFSWQHH